MKAPKRRRVAVCSAALFALGIAGTASAQTCPVGSTCFYVPPAIVHPGGSEPVESEIWLSIPSGVATGTYRVDGGAEVPFTITDAAALQVPLMTAAMSSAVNTPEVRNVFVVSSREDLLVEHKQLRFMSGSYTEGYSETVPRHTVALGTRFRLGGFRMTSPSPIGVAMTSQYAFVTAPTGATITLTAPPGATLPYWTGSTTDTHVLTLAAGQSVSVAANAPLDGALLVATAPVSAASGGRGWLSPCGDDGSDVLVPTSQYGTEFAMRLPTGSATGSDVVVIADVDGTEVRIDGTLVATLAAGTRHSFVPTSPAHVETSQPALVWMNGSRSSCELDTALIPPLVLASLPLAITFNASFAAEVTVVVPTDGVPSLRVDGAMVTPTSTATIPGRADVTMIVFEVGAGLHSVRADHGFQLMAAYAGAGAGVLAYFGPFVACTTAAACPDLGPCSVEACVVNACVSTPIETGMPGECAGGLVCLPDGTCGTLAGPDAGPPDAGPIAEDAGPTAPDSGPAAEDAGPTPRDAGPTPRDAGSMAADAGRGGAGEEGGCGCTVPSARSDRPLVLAAIVLAILATIARPRRRRMDHCPRGNDPSVTSGGASR